MATQNFSKKFFCLIVSRPLIEGNILLHLLRQLTQRADELEQRRVKLRMEPLKDLYSIFLGKYRLASRVWCVV